MGIDGLTLLRELLPADESSARFAQLPVALHDAARGDWRTLARRSPAAAGAETTPPINGDLTRITACLDLRAPWTHGADSPARRAGLASALAALPASAFGPWGKEAEWLMRARRLRRVPALRPAGRDQGRRDPAVGAGRDPPGRVGPAHAAGERPRARRRVAERDARGSRRRPATACCAPRPPARPPRSTRCWPGRAVDGDACADAAAGRAAAAQRRAAGRPAPAAGRAAAGRAERPPRSSRRCATPRSSWRSAPRAAAAASPPASSTAGRRDDAHAAVAARRRSGCAGSRSRTA